MSNGTNGTNGTKIIYTPLLNFFLSFSLACKILKNNIIIKVRWGGG
ncbi:hypothetical protein MCHI_000297 [Candidatus Magnetoovum chiemensis]|nr:hypothetical protein MCHI_000297 [Candidatus Magnetoovum chiemensis]